MEVTTPMPVSAGQSVCFKIIQNAITRQYNSERSFKITFHPNHFNNSRKNALH